MDSLNKSSSIDALASAEWIAKVEGGVQKELKGLEYDGEYPVKCMNCDTELFTIMKVSDKPAKFPIGRGNYAEVPTQRFRAKCPFCDNGSWVVKVHGTIMIGPVTDKTVIADWNYGDFNDPDGMFNEVILVKARNA